MNKLLYWITVGLVLGIVWFVAETTFKILGFGRKRVVEEVKEWNKMLKDKIEQI